MSDKTKTPIEETEQTPEAKAAPKKTPVKPKSKPVEKPAPVEEPAMEKPTRLEDHIRVAVRSNQYGGLVFVNSRTHDKTTWENIDDVQELTVADIRDMKANARRFFEEPWVCVESVTSPGYEMLTKEDVISILGLTRYYTNPKRPEHMSDAITWTAEAIQDEVPSMTKGTKENLIVAVADAVRNGELNQLDRIRAWEETLGCLFLS